MSTTALAMGFLVSRSVTRPCISATSPWCGLRMMLSPFSRKGVLGLQKGPRMELEVGASSVASASLWEISSTKLHRLFVSQEQESLLRSTYDSTPRISEIRWPSFRIELLAWPIEFRNFTPRNHSSHVRSISRAKS